MSTGWREVVARFGMAAHPEGGWYVERWRAAAGPDGQRPVASAILFLLPAGEESRWHRVDADELWQYSAGDPLELRIAPADRKSLATHRLGPDITAGDAVQVVVPAGAWQTARPLGAWTLVGCIVAPAFSFDGFELAPEGWEPPR